MRRRVRSGLFCLALVGLAASAGYGAPRTAVAEMTATMAGRGQSGVAIQYRLWLKGDRMRMETSGPEGGSITLKRGRFGYAYDARQKVAHRVRLPDSPTSTAYPFGDPSRAPGFRKVGKERVGTYTCLLYERAPQGKQGEVTRVWMAQGVPVPIQAKTTGNGITSSLVLKRVRLNVPIPDSHFELPRGTRIVDAGSSPR